MAKQGAEANAEKEEANAERRTSNAQYRMQIKRSKPGSEFEIGRSALAVRRFLDRIPDLIQFFQLDLAQFLPARP